MRILLVNNFVRHGSGIDAAVRIEERALRQAGHEVVAYGKDNHAFDILSPARKIGALVSTLYSLSVRREVSAILTERSFDLVHVHNTVPFITGALYDACRARPGLTIVQSLHNYRATCPISYEFRDGRSCRECSEHSLVRCAVHRCYHRSYIQSAGLVLGRWIDTVRSRPLGMDADAFIAASEFIKQRHSDCGVPAEHIHVLHNAAPDRRLQTAPVTEPRRKLVYVGALIEAKGVFRLLRVARELPEFEFHLIGEGEDRPRLMRQTAAMGLQNVVFHGYLPPDETAAVWSDAFLTLIPSIWDDPCPVVTSESFSLGIPVFASPAGGLPELITPGGTGELVDFENVAGVVARVRRLWGEPDEYCRMRERTRQEYEARFTEAAYARQLLNLLGEFARGRRVGAGL